MGFGNYNNNKRYLDKVISQHRVKPKFMAVMTCHLEKLQDANEVTINLEKEFDLDSAVGIQLDKIGVKAGVSRVLTFNPIYAESKLVDEDFRKYIKARISMNQWDGTMSGLISLWEGLFGEYRIRILDGQDMSIQAEFSGVEDLFELELISHGYYAPKGEGVRVNYLFVMESIVDGELFLGGAIVEESISDYLEDLSEYPELLNGETYIAGAIVSEIITEELEGENI